MDAQPILARIAELLERQCRDCSRGVLRKRVSATLMYWSQPWLISLKVRRLPLGRKTLRSFRCWRECLKKSPRMTREGKLRAMRKANDFAIRDMIRRQLGLAMQKRTNLLRKRVGICSSCL
jgi:hypothetical protein